MNYLIVKEKTRRQVVRKYGLTWLFLRAFLRTHSLKDTSRTLFYKHLYHSFPRRSLAVRTKNRCLFTGRSASVYRFFKLSRIFLRDFARMGKLPGVRKSSW